MQTTGKGVVLSKTIALAGHAFAHWPQLMHFLVIIKTPPSLRSLQAPVGQAAAHAAGLQARHMVASNPVVSPPDVRIVMPAWFQESFWCTRRAQARAHAWQPIHFSIATA